VLALVVALVAIIAFIVFFEAARRKIPISYAKRHVGRQMVGGQQTTMPLKLNMGGVIPVIFASSVLSMPQSLFSALPPKNPQNWYGKIFAFFQVFHAGDPYYELIFLSLICLLHLLSMCRSSLTWKRWRTICASMADSCRASGPGGRRLNT
jgi:preprotein translocase subunit SecY